MKSLVDTRNEKRMTQMQLVALTGINQHQISCIERGLQTPTESTRSRIEKVLGKIDWMETGKIKLLTPNYFKAERLVNRLVRITLTMKQKDKAEIIKLIHKYFKNGGKRR